MNPNKNSIDKLMTISNGERNKKPVNNRLKIKRIIKKAMFRVIPETVVKLNGLAKTESEKNIVNKKNKEALIGFQEKSLFNFTDPR